MSYAHTPPVQRASRSPLGGPLTAAAASLLALLVEWMLLGPGMGFIQPDDLLASSNDSTMVTLAHPVMAGSLLAAAVGAWSGVDRDDRARGRISARTASGVVVGASVPALLVPVGLTALFTGVPHTFSLARVLIVVLVAVLVGALLGLATARWPAAAGMIVAALFASWLYLTAWNALFRLFYPDTFYGPDGEFSNEMLRATRILGTSLTIALGVISAGAVALAHILVPRVRRLVWVAAVSASPLLIWLTSTALAILAAGSEAALPAWPEWSALALGCLVGFVLALLIRRRPDRGV